MEEYKLRLKVFKNTEDDKRTLLRTVQEFIRCNSNDCEIAILRAVGQDGTPILEEFFSNLGFNMDSKASVEESLSRKEFLERARNRNLAIPEMTFHLYNCDNMYDLDKVEALIEKVTTKLSRKATIRKNYFPLPQMKKLCRKLEDDGKQPGYAVFVVHAHESVLAINTDNPHAGYSRLYRTLLEITDDKVLIVIGGDDNYKDQGERDKSVLSRWVRLKIFSQFTEDYVNGPKSFVFSWEDNHHPIHEEALEFYLDTNKKDSQFVPRPRSPSAEVPRPVKEKKLEQPEHDSLQIKQAAEPVKIKKTLENEFPTERNKGRAQPADPLQNKKPMMEVSPAQPSQHTKPTHPAQPPYAGQPLYAGQPPYPGQPPYAGQPPYPGQPPYDSQPPYAGQPPYPGQPPYNSQPPYAGQSPYSSQPPQTSDFHPESAQVSNMANLVIASFYSTKESITIVEKLLASVYKELNSNYSPRQSHVHPNDIPREILKNRPLFLVLVSDFHEFKDLLSSREDKNNLLRDIAKNSTKVGTELIVVITQDVNYRDEDLCSEDIQKLITKLPLSEELMFMSMNETPYRIHRDIFSQLLYHNAENRRLKYRASISDGHVVDVLQSDPLCWEPNARGLKDLLETHGNEKNASIEFWEKSDGTIEQTILCSASEPAKLCKIAKGFATDKQHSILVYSYHSDKRTYETMSNFIHHLDVPVLVPYQPTTPVGLMKDIAFTKPGYLMVSADSDVFKDEVKNLILQHGNKINGIIKNFVGKGVILMLFGDKFYEKGKFASEEVIKEVKMLIKDVIPPDKVTIMTCLTKPYAIHQKGMKELLTLKNPHEAGKEWDPENGLLRYRADITFGKVDKVLFQFSPNWQPEKFILDDLLRKNVKQEKSTLEFWENKDGHITPIVTFPSSRFSSLPSFSFGSSKEKRGPSKSKFV